MRSAKHKNYISGSTIVEISSEYLHRVYVLYPRSVVRSSARLRYVRPSWRIWLPTSRVPKVVMVKEIADDGMATDL